MLDINVDALVSAYKYMTTPSRLYNEEILRRHISNERVYKKRNLEQLKSKSSTVY